MCSVFLSTSLFSLLKLLTDQVVYRASLVSSVGKESAYNAGGLGLIRGLERSSGVGNDSPLQYSCLENPMSRGAWWAIGHGVTKSQT